LIGVFLVNFAVVEPVEKSLQELDDAIQAEINKYEKRKRLLAKSQRLDSQYQEYWAQFAQNQSNEQTMSSILSEIEKAAQASQLKISDLKPKRTENKNGYNIFSVSLMIDSDFRQIISFLHSLQSAPHLFGVDEIAFEKGGSKDSPQVKTRLSLRKILIP
jgi:Tfp pilus assembly protein PilO